MKRFCIIMIFILSYTCLSSQTKIPATSLPKGSERNQMDKIINRSVVLKCSVHKAFEMFTVNVVRLFPVTRSWAVILSSAYPRVTFKYCSVAAIAVNDSEAL